MSATLYVFAGPNGSGKSTVIKDYIAFYGLDDIEYICPDIYAATLFGDIRDLMEKYQKAMNFAAYKRERLLKEQKSMIVETVLSHSSKLDFVQTAKQAGYCVISVFIGTSSPSINIARVQKRVSQGGHDVPEDKIRSRYVRSMENLPLLAECSDELYVYDNSGTRPVLALSVIDKEMFMTTNMPDWVRNLFQ